MDIFIGLHGALSLRCVHSVGGRKGVWVSIGVSGNCCIANSRAELPWKYLGPNGTGNSISQRTPDIITGQEKTGQYSKIYNMLVGVNRKHATYYLRSCLDAAWILAWAGYGNKPPADWVSIRAQNESTGSLPIPSRTCPPITPEWLDAPWPPRKRMRIPKATVNSKVPTTMKTLSLRAFKMTNPRSDPVMTDAKLS